MPRLRDPEKFKSGLFMGLFGLGGAIACILAWFTWQDRFWVALKGPTEVSLAELAKITDPSQLPSPWTKLTFEKGFDLDLAVTEERIGDDLVEYKYLLLQVDDRWLIATVKEDFEGNVLTGELYHARDNLNNEAFAKIFQEHKDVHQGRLFPFEMHTAKDFGENWRAFPWVMAFLGGCGLFLGCFGSHAALSAFREDQPSAFAGQQEPAVTATDDAIARIMRDAQNRRQS